jgi:hypothetical protein
VDADGSQSPMKDTKEIEALASSQSVPECVICGYEVDGEVILPCYHTAYVLCHGNPLPLTLPSQLSRLHCGVHREARRQWKSPGVSCVWQGSA